MKHTDLEPEQRQRPLGPSIPPAIKETLEWVHYALGIERNTTTGKLRTVDKPAPTPVNLPLLQSHPAWCQKIAVTIPTHATKFPGIELDEFGGTSWQATLCALTIEGVEQRFGPPHMTDIGGKSSKWWGFRCGDVRFSVYNMQDYNEPHIGGTTLSAAWFALALLRVPSSLAWLPQGVPIEWWAALVNYDVPRILPHLAP